MVNKPIRLVGLRHIHVWKNEPTDKSPRFLLYKLEANTKGIVLPERLLSQVTLNVRQGHDREALWSDVNFPQPVDILPNFWYTLILRVNSASSNSVRYVSG
jgi:hypothetical protein